MSRGAVDGESAGARTLTLAEAVVLAERQAAGGDVASAGQLCRKILDANPQCAPAWHLLGVIAAQAGDLAAAIDGVGRATDFDPASATYLSNLCELLRRAGDLDQASVAGRRALALAPHHPQTLNNLGIVHFERREYEAAAELYRRAIAAKPRYAEAHNNLGNALRSIRDFDAALAAYAEALALQPRYADALNNLGSALRDVGRTAEAERAYRKAHALEPLSVSLLGNLALAVKELGRLEEAAAILAALLSLDPDNIVAMTRLALVLLELARTDEAEAACRRALALRRDDPQALNALGLVTLKRGDLPAALALFRRALAGDPALAEAHTNIGNILKEQGDLVEARKAHERAADLDPRQAGFFLNLADGRRFTHDDPYLERMQALERDLAMLSPTSAMHLRFALAKAYDDLGLPARAFDHMAEAARLKRAQIRYDEAATLEVFDRVRAAFDRQTNVGAGRGGDPSKLPVFIIGMPRSGTTLVEQIIASHPLVHGAGELEDLAAVVAEAGVDFPEQAARLGGDDRRRLAGAYLSRLRRHSASASRITDKMPANFLFAGLIDLILPNARIIHVVRDPVDTCLSCFSKLFAEAQDHTYDLAELGRYYRKYAALMEHWRAVLPAGRIFDVRYEDLVDNLEGEARRLVDHCGLPWDTRCLDFHASRRTVRTASALQVRRPIYATARGRWLAYRGQLAPLLAELAKR